MRKPIPARRMPGLAAIGVLCVSLAVHLEGCTAADAMVISSVRSAEVHPSGCEGEPITLPN